MHETVAKDLDVIVAEFHQVLLRPQAKWTGMAYARYSSDFQHSVVDQIRSIFEYAVKNSIYIPREHVFFDLSVRGCKDRRAGLDPIRELLKQKAAPVLLVFTTNRLYRKMYKCMKFVEEEVVERGIRCVFVKTGIDTAEGNRWRMPLQVNAMLDELTSTVYVENIRAAHEGLFLKKCVVYTIPYGYMGKEVPGTPTKRMRPRREYAIDVVTSDWVKKIFTWFVEDRLPLCRIIERLNDENAPLTPMSNGVYWTGMAVRYILTNACYRGSWTYGRGQNVWQSKMDYVKRVMREKPLREAQFEDLRLVSNETWYKAQSILAALPQNSPGRKPRDGDTKKRPRILNGLLFCKEHDRELRVGGTHGAHMYCPICQNLPKEKRPIFSYLNRSLALRVTCRSIAERICSDTNLVQLIVSSCRSAVEAAQEDGGDARLAVCKSRLEKLERQIRFIMDNPGEAEADQNESAVRLKICRADRAELLAEFGRIEDAIRQPRDLPTEADVRAMIDDLERILLNVAEGNDPENVGAFRELLELLTRSRIDCEQIGERKRQGGWLRGHFDLDLGEVVRKRFGNFSTPEMALTMPLSVDYRESKITIAEGVIDEVMERYNNGILVTAIAIELGIDRHQVSDAVRIWHQRNGLPLPVDGRVRRASVPNKLLKAPDFQAIADEAKALYDDNLLIEEIAKKMNRCRRTIHAAVKFWFESRGLEMPDGRNRRKTLPRKQRDKGNNSIDLS